MRDGILDSQSVKKTASGIFQGNGTGQEIAVKSQTIQSRPPTDNKLTRQV